MGGSSSFHYDIRAHPIEIRNPQSPNRNGISAMAHPPSAACNRQCVRIPMSDGITLAAALHWPPGAAQDGSAGRFPAIIEYTPYHKINNRAYGPRATRYPYFASYGYVFVNVDIRGTGD